ncbi:MAG: hypothetical protein RL095_2994 [Verrucomicrobiota bacterium]|jgi:hypothetical protein
MSAIAIRRLIEDAAALPDLHGKPLLEKAISLADASNERQLGWEARLAFISATHEAPDPIKALAAFGWLLKEYDRAPDEGHKDISRLLWLYKWMFNTINDYPNISREHEDRALEDFRQRLSAAGFGLHSWYSAKLSTLAARGDVAGVAALLPEYRKTPRDAMSDCKACCPGGLASWLRLLRRPVEEILQVMQPVIQGRATCSHVPANAWPGLALDAARNGLPEALEWYRRCWTSTLSFVGDPMNHDDILETALVHGFFADAWTLISRHSGRDWPQFKPYQQLRLLRQIRVLFSLEPRSGWPFPASLEFNGRQWPLAEFRRWVESESTRLDSAFDKRNGNSWQQELTAQALHEADSWKAIRSDAPPTLHPDVAASRLQSLHLAGQNEEAASFAREAASALPYSGALRALFADHPEWLDAASRRQLEGDKKGRGHAASPKSAGLGEVLAAAPGRPVKAARKGLTLPEVMAPELPKNFHGRVLAQVEAAPDSPLSLLAVLRLATTGKLGNDPLVPLYGLLRRDFSENPEVIALAVDILSRLHFVPPQLLSLARLALDRGHPEAWNFQRVLRDAEGLAPKERLLYAEAVLNGQGELLPEDRLAAVEILLQQSPPRKAEAMQQALAALAMSHSPVEMRVYLARRLHYGEVEGALDLLAPLHQDPDPDLVAAALMESSRLHLYRGSPEALDFCDRAQALTSTRDDEDHLYRAAVLNRLGRHQEAIVEARLAAPGSQARLQAVAALEILERPADVIEELGPVMAAHQEAPSSMTHSLAKALFQTGRADEAIAALKPLTQGKYRRDWDFPLSAELLLQFYGDERRHARHAASLRRILQAEAEREQG